MGAFRGSGTGGKHGSWFFYVLCSSEATGWSVGKKAAEGDGGVRLAKLRQLRGANLRPEDAPDLFQADGPLPLPPEATEPP